MAPCNGTQQWHHIHFPKVGRHPPPNHSTLQWHPTMAPSNGTLWRLHPAMAPRPLHPALAPWCHVQSAKVVRRPPPPIGSKNPYSYRYLGKNMSGGWGHLIFTSLTWEIRQSRAGSSLPFSQSFWRIPIWLKPMADAQGAWPQMVTSQMLLVPGKHNLRSRYVWQCHDSAGKINQNPKQLILIRPKRSFWEQPCIVKGYCGLITTASSLLALRWRAGVKVSLFSYRMCAGSPTGVMPKQSFVCAPTFRRSVWSGLWWWLVAFSWCVGGGDEMCCDVMCCDVMWYNVMWLVAEWDEVGCGVTWGEIIWWVASLDVMSRAVTVMWGDVTWYDAMARDRMGWNGCYVVVTQCGWLWGQVMWWGMVVTCFELEDAVIYKAHVTAPRLRSTKYYNVLHSNYYTPNYNKLQSTTMHYSILHRNTLHCKILLCSTHYYSV